MRPPLFLSTGFPSCYLNFTHTPLESHLNWIQEEFKKGSCGVRADSGRHCSQSPISRSSIETSILTDFGRTIFSVLK